MSFYYVAVNNSNDEEVGLLDNEEGNGEYFDDAYSTEDETEFSPNEVSYFPTKNHVRFVDHACNDRIPSCTTTTHKLESLANLQARQKDERLSRLLRMGMFVKGRGGSSHNNDYGGMNSKGGGGGYKHPRLFDDSSNNSTPQENQCNNESISKHLLSRLVNLHEKKKDELNNNEEEVDGNRSVDTTDQDEEILRQLYNNSKPNIPTSSSPTAHSETCKKLLKLSTIFITLWLLITAIVLLLPEDDHTLLAMPSSVPSPAPTKGPCSHFSRRADGLLISGGGCESKPPAPAPTIPPCKNDRGYDDTFPPCGSSTTDADNDDKGDGYKNHDNDKNLKKTSTSLSFENHFKNLSNIADRYLKF